MGVCETPVARHGGVATLRTPVNGQSAECGEADALGAEERGGEGEAGTALGWRSGAFGRALRERERERGSGSEGGRREGGGGGGSGRRLLPRSRMDRGWASARSLGYRAALGRGVSPGAAGPCAPFPGRLPRSGVVVAFPLLPGREPWARACLRGTWRGSSYHGASGSPPSGSSPPWRWRWGAGVEPPPARFP